MVLCLAANSCIVFLEMHLKKEERMWFVKNLHCFFTFEELEFELNFLLFTLKLNNIYKEVKYFAKCIITILK